MEKAKNIILMGNYYLKENISMEKEMENAKNIILMVNYYLKENISMGKNGMETDIIKMVIWNMK